MHEEGRNIILGMQKMDDLLREIKKLSARFKESDSVSSKEDTLSQQTSSKRIAKKRQKNRHKKHHGRKRRMKYQPDLEADSSSFTDCTDESIIKDYIENITADLSDSDVDSRLQRGAFLVKRDLSSAHDFNMHMARSPEVDETDSFSESLRFTNARKKRRRYKRHSLESIDHSMDYVSNDQKERIHNVLTTQYRIDSRPLHHHKKLKLEKSCHGDDIECTFSDSMDVVTSQDSSQANSTSENSESSSNSQGSNEADDEGEESSFESSLVSIKPVIPWWEEQNQMMGCEDNEEEKLGFPLDVREKSRYDFKTRLLTKSNAPVVCESGVFVVYANHKIKTFVLHRDSNELSMYIANKKEQNQVHQLAILYNLQCTIEEAGKSCKAVLTKTLATSEPNQEPLKLFLRREITLRRRKDRPRPDWNAKRRKVTSLIVDTSNFTSELMDVPLPESNVGNQMLRTMGWKPGQGLGKDSTGMTNPIKAVKRPRHVGFGHPSATR